MSENKNFKELSDLKTLAEKVLNTEDKMYDVEELKTQVEKFKWDIDYHYGKIREHKTGLSIVVSMMEDLMAKQITPTNEPINIKLEDYPENNSSITSLTGSDFDIDKKAYNND
jgi:hypothetical protein